MLSLYGCILLFSSPPLLLSSSPPSLPHNPSLHVPQVDVKVNLGPDQEQEARMVTAAALAESARQLAQSAAEFGKEEEV